MERVSNLISRKLASQNPSTISCTDPNKESGQVAWNWSAEQSSKATHEPQRSSKTPFIDLSSDPIDCLPQCKPQPTPSNTCLKATWDPISSSAPETHDIQDLLSSPPVSKEARLYPHHKATNEGDRSDSDSLPDLGNVDFSSVRTLKRSQGSSSRPNPQTSKQTAKKVVVSAGERERERKQKAEAKEADKERKRLEKERAKEERALQKEQEKALAEVNKLRTDKKVSTPEMIVDIPASIKPSLKVQIEALLGDLDVEHKTWNSTVEHVVKWRRKVTSRFNEEMGFWEPTPLRIKDESHVMVLIQATEFVKVVLGEEGQDLEAHVLLMKSKFPNSRLIYLIEGLTPWMRKNRNLLNRQFASAVRNLGGSTESGSSSGLPRRRNNNQSQEYIDEDKIEDALLSLQVLHGTLVHHTNAPVETAQWVAVFTQHISTIPYRKARDASVDAGFCMESGQVRTGDGAKDTYIRMLQEITRVTAPIAYGIAIKYESVTDLMRGLENEGPLALAECRKSANKDGALTDRTVGQAISKRVYKIFLGQDAASTDV
jgi:crossover junction endonuclease EME1